MTTKHDISRWFLAGVAKKATHMIVVCDTFDHDDYPVYVGTCQDVRRVEADYNGKNMQRVMEVYNMSADMETQLAQKRAFNY